MDKERAAQLVDAGVWLRLSGDLEGARKLFERALKLDDGNARAMEFLGLARQEPEPDEGLGSTVGSTFAPEFSPSTIMRQYQAEGGAALPPAAGWDRPAPLETDLFGGLDPASDAAPEPSPPAGAAMFEPMAEPQELFGEPPDAPATALPEPLPSGPDRAPVPPPQASGAPRSAAVPLLMAPGLTVRIGGEAKAGPLAENEANPATSPTTGSAGRPTQRSRSPWGTIVIPTEASQRPYGSTTGGSSISALGTVVIGSQPGPSAAHPPSDLGALSTGRPPRSTLPTGTVVISNDSAPQEPPQPVRPLHAAPPSMTAPTVRTAPAEDDVPAGRSVALQTVIDHDAPTDRAVALHEPGPATEPEQPAWAWRGTTAPQRARAEATAPAAVLPVVPGASSLAPGESRSPGETVGSGWDRGSAPGIRLDEPALAPVSFDFLAPSRKASSVSSGRRHRDEEIRRLIKSARSLIELDDHTGAMDLISKAQVIDPQNAEVLVLRERSEKTLTAMFESKLGSMLARPRVLLKDDEVIWLNLDHRAGFVLAQIDGSVSFEDIFSVSGMSHFDTVRILAQLVEEGVISRG